MDDDSFLRFRHAHAADVRCSRLGWEVIAAVWQTAAEAGGEVKVTDLGSAHISGYHHVGGEDVLAWIAYPGDGTRGGYPRLEFYFEKVTRLLSAEADRVKLMREVGEHLANVTAWTSTANRLGRGESVRSCKLSLARLEEPEAAMHAADAAWALVSFGVRSVRRLSRPVPQRAHVDARATSDLTWCLAEPTPELQRAVAAFSKAADLVVAGELIAARAVIDAIDEEPLRRRYRAKRDRFVQLGGRRFQAGSHNGRRRDPTKRQLRALYERDGWRCRYCRIEVLDDEARRRLAELLNPLGGVPLSGSTDAGKHAAVVNLSATFDHVHPHSEGGGSQMDDLVTSCWFCNFGKGSATIDFLGLRDPRDREPVRDGWDGLRRILA